jgi:hypothetical protein
MFVQFSKLLFFDVIQVVKKKNIVLDTSCVPELKYVGNFDFFESDLEDTSQHQLHDHAFCACFVLIKNFALTKSGFWHVIRSKQKTANTKDNKFLLEKTRQLLPCNICTTKNLLVLIISYSYIFCCFVIYEYIYLLIIFTCTH